MKIYRRLEADHKQTSTLIILEKNISTRALFKRFEGTFLTFDHLKF